MNSSRLDALDVATPERVALSLPIAGIGARALAWLVDVAILFTFWVVVYFVLSLLVSDVLGLFQSFAGVVQTLLVISVFATQWVFWTVCELAWRGQTPGKRVLRIRVVREDGAPVGFYESALRNLARAVDFLPFGYATGLLTMLVNPQHRRLGDLLAGTVLVREEQVNLDRYAAPVLDALPVSPVGAQRTLSAEELELVLSYLERAAELWPEPRRRIGERLVRRLGAELDDEARARILATPEAVEAFLRQRLAESAR